MERPRLRLQCHKPSQDGIVRRPAGFLYETDLPPRDPNIAPEFLLRHQHLRPEILETGSDLGFLTGRGFTNWLFYPQLNINFTSGRDQRQGM